MRIAAFPFNRPTAFATLYLGGMLRHTCTWSGMACPSTNAMPICSQSSRRILPMSLRSVPKIAFCRYFGTMMMWYRQYHRTWLWLCHSRIVVSPLCGLGGATPGETTFLFTNQRRNGRACSSLTARGGGLPGLSYVLAEFVALAQARRLPRLAARTFVSDLGENPDIDTVWVDEALHREAMALLMARPDKTYSLCDAVSFVLMRQRHCTEALTTDRHFEQEGFQRLL